MRASLILARQTVTHDDGRVDLIDAGWNAIVKPKPFVVVTLITCPSELCGTNHKMRIDLLDDAGETIGKPVAKTRKFRAERNKAIPVGSGVAVPPIVTPIEHFDHPPGRYALRLSINEMADDDWILPIVRAKA